MISTRGRYALRILVDLAEQGNRRDDFIPLKEAAARQGISLKYMERILPLLTEADFIEALPGKGGGYRLKREPRDVRVGDVLRLTEGDLAPVACLAEGAGACERTDTCRTLAMWKDYHALTLAFFDGYTIEDLMKKE